MISSRDIRKLKKIAKLLSKLGFNEESGLVSEALIRLNDKVSERGALEGVAIKNDKQPSE